ncbi:MAG: benzoylformate decarboxylase [Planctomycetaceae bacterium]|jgi:benzoylformate decarboxylase
MAALPDLPSMQFVLGLQEAIVVAMADGFSRASGQLSACNVHVAPGLGNAMGSIYNANWVGSPVIITAGQQEQGHGLTEPLLYDTLPPIASPWVKWATEVNRLEDLPRIMRRAAKIAMSPPTGPVFISLPGDILNDATDLDLGQSTRVDAVTRPSDSSLQALAKRLATAKKLAIVAGHELSTTDSLQPASQLATMLGAPVYQQTIAHGAHFLSEHNCYIGALSREQKRVRAILEDYDTVLFLGSDVLRMSVYSKIDPLPPHVSVLQIAERTAELGKNYPADVAINAHPGETLRALLPVLASLVNASQASARVSQLKADNWSARRDKLMESLQSRAQQNPIDADYLMMAVAKALPKDAVLVDEGLTSSRFLGQLAPYRDAKGYFGLASGGIGFAVAGVVGMQLAQPSRPHIAVIGDGSSMYSIQALWTAAHLKLPITYVIANNHSYRILKQRVQAGYDTTKFIGMDFDDPPIDFAQLAQSMGVSSRTVTDPADLSDALNAAIGQNGPQLLDVHIDKSL